jgi:hypothetical protein
MNTELLSKSLRVETAWVLGLDATIILKWILHTQDVRMWTGFIWLRIGPIEGCSEYLNGSFGFIKCAKFLDQLNVRFNVFCFIELSFVALLTIFFHVKAVSLRHAGAKGEENWPVLILDLGTRWGVSGKRHILAALYPPKKNLRYPLDRRLGGPQLVWTQRLEEKSFVCARDRTTVIQSVVKHYVD